MRSKTTVKFRELYAKLPAKIRQQAKDAYKLFMADPNHPGLNLEKVLDKRPVYSARISGKYRAFGELVKDTMIWFWIGDHTEYDQILNKPSKRFPKL